MARPPPFSFSSSSSLPNFACPDSSEPQVIIDCDSSYEELVVRQNVPSGRRDGLSGTPDPPSSAAVHDHLPRDVTRPVARPASSCSSSSSSSFSQASTSRYLPSPSGEDDGEHEDDETTTSSSSAPDSDTSAVRRSDRLARQPKPQYTLSSTSSNLSIFFGFKSSVAGAGTALAHKTSTKRRRVGRKRKLPAVLTPKDAQIDENIDPRKAEHPPPDQPFLFLWGSSQKDVRPEPDWLPRVGQTRMRKGRRLSGCVKHAIVLAL
ncbi:hypothetical protein CSUI_010996 [Cystoisospora suis]|uniref:Uncharacterized protein n=1 Tax=Cystoisospora suis TaxID=483139 RepID=A0A2C6KFN7_9APIC|nr:hypothetical protein CSUI_010996 [Cystoisospora suis]